MPGFINAVRRSTLPARLFSCLALLVAFVATPAMAQRDFVTFESGQARPMALTPDGSTLVVVNTPDNRVEIFNVSDNPYTNKLAHIDSVPVGLEPVAIAARSNTEIWVVNHMSDSVSIIDISATPARVTRTLLVGDEPRDIVFAGTGFNRAFISAAHRGQHLTHSSISGVPGAGDPQLTTPGVGRADVWVFDANSLGSTIGGTPIRILTAFADTPRALAASPDGSTVYFAAFKSGNETTVINEVDVPNGFNANGVPGPDDNVNGASAPEVGVIVKFDGTNWLDSKGTNWNSDVQFNLPDHDVFSINANTFAANTLVEYDHVGTVLFNMAINPVTGKVYVTNTELPNHIDFEGPGVHGGSTVQGRLSESRITVLDPTNGGVDPQHLNQHIDYSQLHTDVGANHAAIDAQAQHSLATPVQLVTSSDGTKIYMAAFGSAKIGVFDAADIESANFEANFDPTTESANYISTGGGPSGLVLDEARDRLYVLTRFANQVEVINLANNATTETHSLHNPEPAEVVDGRRFLYDALVSSANGEASCSSCHIFGTMDQLAWNLGNPDDHVTTNTVPSAVPLPTANSFHPMKGPMTTQTLKGMATHGAMHWRGDRVDGFFGLDNCNSSGSPCDEDFSFRNFIVAFEGLVGKHGTITNAEMQQFADFTLEMMLPPNPVRALDNSLTSLAQSGRTRYFNNISDTVATCDGCHTLDPEDGFFGTAGEQSFEGETQNFKVPQTRNVYDKIGMFGTSRINSHQGDQVRGYGVLHDGSIDTVFNFLGATVFGLTNNQQRQLEAFTLQFPSDLAPIVGQQVTLDSTNAAAVNPRINLMIARAATSFPSLMMGGIVTECDVVVKGSIGGVETGWYRDSGGQFISDTGALISDIQLRALAVTEGPLTYTCAPPGSGERMGINRDRDNFNDGLDNCPDVANNSQADADFDGIGDACELPDTDGDGVADIEDNCPLIANADQLDTNNSGRGDACETLPPGC